MGGFDITPNPLVAPLRNNPYDYLFGFFHLTVLVCHCFRVCCTDDDGDELVDVSDLIHSLPLTLCPPCVGTPYMWHCKSSHKWDYYCPGATVTDKVYIL